MRPGKHTTRRRVQAWARIGELRSTSAAGRCWEPLSWARSRAGGKGAAIGAAAGAATGAGTQMATRGRAIHVPLESLLTFRLEQPLYVSAVPDDGYMREGHHYHYYPAYPENR